MYTMKKINCLLFLAIMLGFTCNMSMGISTPDYPYYNCPSMENFSPMALPAEYCQRSAKQKPSEYTSCLREYKQSYNKAKLEYRNNKCRLSDVRYTELRYGIGVCKVDYTTKPAPKILSTKNTTDDARCINRLKSSLARRFPNIEE